MGSTSLNPGEPTELAPGVRRVLCNNPGVMTGPGTNTYLVGTDELAVIDPGPINDAHIEAILAAAGEAQIRWIICTHTHGDHAPGAAPLKERTGGEVLGFADLGALVCDRHLSDGDRVGPEGFELLAIHTPGHASDHLCFLLENQGLLFAGDHVMDASTVVIAPPDGDMAHYLASLVRLREWVPALQAIAPAHGHVIEDPAARLDYYISHRLAREAQVLEALRQAGLGGATAEELVRSIYTDVHEMLWPIARFSVWAHLRKLGDDGSAQSVAAHDLEAMWAATDA